MARLHSRCEVRCGCSQVTGDDHVPAGRRTWHALAAPAAEPWSEEEAELVELREQLLPGVAPGEGAPLQEPASHNVSFPRHAFGV